MYKRQDKSAKAKFTRTTCFATLRLTRSMSLSKSELNKKRNISADRRNGIFFTQPNTKSKKALPPPESEESDNDELMQQFNFIVNQALYKQSINDRDMMYGPEHPTKIKYRTLSKDIEKLLKLEEKCRKFYHQFVSKEKIEEWNRSFEQM